MLVQMPEIIYVSQFYSLFEQKFFKLCPIVITSQNRSSNATRSVSYILSSYSREQLIDSACHIVHIYGPYDMGMFAPSNNQGLKT